MNTTSYNYKYGATILRYLLGFAILKDFITLAYNKKFLFYKTSIVSENLYSDIINYYKISYLNYDFNNSNFINLYLILSILFSLFFMLGILTRLSVIFLFFSLFLFKIRNLYLIDGADNVISAVLPFFFFINTISFSDRSEDFKQKIINNNPKFKKLVIFLSNIFCYAIMVQMCIVYLSAGIHKLYGEVWREDTALYYILNSDDFSPSFLNSCFTQSLFLVKSATWFTIFFQLTFSFLIWYKPLKIYYIILGIILHISIFVMMKIDNFSFVMISCYSIFISNKQYMNILNWLKKCKIKFI